MADQNEFARARFDELDKSKLRNVLYQEQGWLCIYCERRLREEHPAPRIDHWRPLSANPTLALHWRNLYLSCPTASTCDVRKHESPLRAVDGSADLPWPVDHQYDRCIGFTSLGEMYVRSDAPLDDSQRRALILAIGRLHAEEEDIGDNGILNLNHPALVAAREAALEAERERIRRKYKNSHASGEDRSAHAAKMLEQPTLDEYVSVRVCWLRRMLGEARGDRSRRRLRRRGSGAGGKP